MRLDASRGSGRTERMLREAERQAADGSYVVVLCATPQHRAQLRERFAEMVPDGRVAGEHKVYMHDHETGDILGQVTFELPSDRGPNPSYKLKGDLDFLGGDLAFDGTLEDYNRDSEG